MRRRRGGKKIGGMASVRMAACAVLVWAVVSGVSGSGAAAEAEQDSNLIETKTGWQFADDDIVDFDAPAASPGAAPAPAPAKAISGRVPLADGGFESANVTGNATVVATDGTVLPNWMPGGAGVSVMQSPPYQRSSFDATSKYLVMLNNPASAGNGTQGSITTTLAANPGTGKTFTIQYDCARCPDGPLNLLSAIRVSAIAGSAKTFILHHVPYNATDTQAAITWSRQSFVFEGTGAATSIMLESMSEKYGPMVDNIVQLTGSHVLSAAPPATARLSVWQPVFTVLVVVAMAGFHGCPLTQLLSLL